MSNDVANSLRLEVDLSSPRNPISNPSGQLGLFGWALFDSAFTAVSGSSSPVAEDGFAFKWAASATTVVETPKVPVRAGTTTMVWLRAIASANRSMGLRLRFFDAEGVTVAGTQPQTGFTVTTSAATFSHSIVAPAGAVSACAVLNPGSTTSSAEFTLGRVAIRSGLASGAPVPAYVPADWVNIISKSTRIQTEQGNTLNGVEDDLSVGTLVATIRDATLDPATSSTLTKGRPIRVTASVGGVRKSVWRGTLVTADADYEDTKTGPNLPSIVVTATDDAQPLGEAVCNYEVSGGFHNQIMHSAGAAGVVSWDGTSTPRRVADAVPIARADGSKSADWITRSCNSNGGYAWIDSSGRLTHQLVSYMPTAPVATLSDRYADAGALYYTGLGLNYGTRSLVNRLMVRRINLDEAEDNGAKDYGPYIASASEEAYGPATATIEITTGSPSAIANAVLPVFATPKIFPTAMRLALTDGNAAALLALGPYTPVRVKRTSPAFNDVVRILRVAHTIDATPSGITWLTSLTPKPLETAATAPVTPPPAGADTGPSDVVGPPAGILGERSRGSNFALPAGNPLTAIPFDQVQASNGITWDGTNSRFVIPRTGRYQVNSAVLFNPLNGVLLGLELNVNGLRRQVNHDLGTASLKTLTVGKSILLAEADVVQIRAYVGASGGSIYGDLLQGSTVSIAYLGP